MNVAYIEMIGGASGNMLLGAFLDAGADLAEIERALRTIPLPPWTLEHELVVKCGIAATYVDFSIPGDHVHALPVSAPADTPELHRQSEAHDHHGEAHDRARHAKSDHQGRHLSEVLALVDASGLSKSQKERATSIYRRLAEAEAKVHGSTPEAIHFHEVGAVDAILDVAATCVALDLLDVGRVEISAFPTGRGSISMQHGRYPNPPPATYELLRGYPTYDAGIVGEMVTTTGAAILTTLAKPSDGRPSMRADRIGYGAGRADFAIPNLTRVTIGVSETADFALDEVSVIEANIDDMQPQYFELAIERLFAAGALDVWLTPVVMKKSRPGLVCSAIVPVERESACAALLLSQTTTLGVRVRRERRYTAGRHIEEIPTVFGSIRVKVASFNGVTRRTLEYDDVVRIARERALPIADVARQLEALLPPL